MEQKQKAYVASRAKKVVIPKLPYSNRINRWTGKPHEHKQEIARRLRQQQAG